MNGARGRIRDLYSVTSTKLPDELLGPLNGLSAVDSAGRFGVRSPHLLPDELLEKALLCQKNTPRN